MTPEKQDETRRIAVAEFAQALARLLQAILPPPIPILPRAPFTDESLAKEQEPLKVLPYMDTKTLAGLLGLGAQTLRKWRITGGGPPYVRMGGARSGRVLYKREDVDTWLAERRYPHTAAETVQREFEGRNPRRKRPY